MTASDFKRWKHNPVTQLFRAYLVAKRRDTRVALLDAWEANELEAGVTDEARGAANTFRMLADLLGPDGKGEPAFDAVRKFFEETDKETDATEDH